MPNDRITSSSSPACRGGLQCDGGISTREPWGAAALRWTLNTLLCCHPQPQQPLDPREGPGGTLLGFQSSFNRSCA